MRFAYFKRKMAKIFANSGDPDQTHVLWRLIWVCTVCQVPFYGSPEYNGLIVLTGQLNSKPTDRQSLQMPHSDPDDRFFYMHRTVADTPKKDSIRI